MNAAAFTETLKSWETFYFTAAGASATLIGLMFVALSLAQSLISNVTVETFKAFASPSILHFTTILLLSLTLLIPPFTQSGLGIVMLVGGMIGSAVSSHYVIRLIRAAFVSQDFNLGDWLAQIILPTISYLLILLGGVGFVSDQSYLAFIGLCLAILALFMCAITNTWGMVVWVVEQTKKS